MKTNSKKNGKAPFVPPLTGDNGEFAWEDFPEGEERGLGIVIWNKENDRYSVYRLGEPANRVERYHGNRECLQRDYYCFDEDVFNAKDLAALKRFKVG